jgi:hypothetical protein
VPPLHLESEMGTPGTRPIRWRSRLFESDPFYRSEHMGQTRVAEVDLESGLRCYMFCDGSEEMWGFGDPADTNLCRQIAPGDSNVGSTPTS